MTARSGLKYTLSTASKIALLNLKKLNNFSTDTFKVQMASVFQPEQFSCLWVQSNIARGHLILQKGGDGTTEEEWCAISWFAFLWQICVSKAHLLLWPGYDLFIKVFCRFENGYRLIQWSLHLSPFDFYNVYEVTLNQPDSNDFFTKTSLRHWHISRGGLPLFLCTKNITHDFDFFNTLYRHSRQQTMTKLYNKRLHSNEPEKI